MKTTFPSIPCSYLWSHGYISLLLKLFHFKIQQLAPFAIFIHFSLLSRMCAAIASGLGLFMHERNQFLLKVSKSYLELASCGGAFVCWSQLCPTLCNPMDCGPPGSSAHGILLARMLEWVAIPLSRGSSQPRDQTPVSCIAGRFFTVWA